MATPAQATATRKQILETLAEEGLSNVLWNVDSRDNSSPHPDADTVIANIDSDVGTALKNKELGYLIVLFHDINPITAGSIETYIKKLTESVKKHGRQPVYASSRQEVDAILEQYKDKS